MFYLTLIPNWSNQDVEKRAAKESKNQEIMSVPNRDLMIALEMAVGRKHTLEGEILESYMTKGINIFGDVVFL